jgi:hypothetical protein
MPLTLRFPHARDAEPNAKEVAEFVAALGSRDPTDSTDDRQQRERMTALLADYTRQMRAGPAAAERWEETFRREFPAEAWRLATPPVRFPSGPLRKWKRLRRRLSFLDRSQLAFSLFIAPVLEATLDRFGLAALRNPRLQVDPFADGAFDLSWHLGHMVAALRRRIAEDPYPRQRQRDRHMERLLRRYARQCGLPVEPPPEPHRRPPPRR